MHLKEDGREIPVWIIQTFLSIKRERVDSAINHPCL